VAQHATFITINQTEYEALSKKMTNTTMKNSAMNAHPSPKQYGMSNEYITVAFESM